MPATIFLFALLESSVGIALTVAGAIACTVACTAAGTVAGTVAGGLEFSFLILYSLDLLLLLLDPLFGSLLVSCCQGFPLLLLLVLLCLLFLVVLALFIVSFLLRDSGKLNCLRTILIIV